MKIVQTDTSHVVLDPQAPAYWSEESLAAEARRAFEICEGCRLCFKYCSTFPDIFERIEATAGNNVLEVRLADFDRPVSECFQCKLCLVKCPYTEKEGHAFKLDLPALFRRYKAVRRLRPRFGPRALRDYLFARPALIGRLGGVFPRLFNWMNRLGPARYALHLTMGIHRAKALPAVAPERFTKWFARYRQTVTSASTPAVESAAAESVGPGEQSKLGAQPTGGAATTASSSPDGTVDLAPRRVAIFPTCYGEYNEPAIPQAAVEVLNKNGCVVSCHGSSCCGAPQLDLPDFDTARKWAQKVIHAHAAAIDSDTPIIALNPTCSLTMKRDYPTLFPPGPARDRAAKFAALVKDGGEFLWELKQADALNRDFKSTPGGTVYHAPCHLRAQNIGFRTRDVLRLIPDNPIEFVDECSCHDGSFAFKKETFALSRRYGKNAFDRLREAGAPARASDCPLAAMQLEEGAALDSRPEHSFVLLAKAYRADGFEKKL